jgi:2-iminobutanoate/2-iminopropanoate deaminase
MAQGFNPPGVVKPFGAFTNAAWAPQGETLFVAGQVSADENGELVGEGDIKAQTRQVLRNIQIILESVGGTLDDIQVVNVYVTDMSGLMDLHEVRREMFKEPYPASTLVQVTALVKPEYLVEINAVAVIPRDRVKK